MEEPFNQFEHLDLTDRETEIVDNVVFDLPKLVDKDEAMFILANLLEQFKEDKGMITEENISSFSYLFNKFLTHINLIRVDEVLLEMYFEGEMLVTLNEDDEWVWSISDEARDELCSDDDDDDDE